MRTPSLNALVLATLTSTLTLPACRGPEVPADVATDAPSDIAVDASDAPVVPDDVQRPDVPPPPTPYSGPDDHCPGSAHCTGTTGDGRFYVGAATESITPTLVDHEWDDANNNGAIDDGETFTDTNGNGMFDGTWMAGFGFGRPARSVRNELTARAIAFRYNDTTVAYAIIDAVGFFADQIDLVRADPQLAGIDLDHVMVGSTHCHECADTVGIWGRRPLERGINEDHLRLVRERIARALRRAVDSLRPARMRVAQAVTADPMTNSTLAYVNDVRDPVLYDPTVTIVRFTEDANPTTTIATWVNWTSHPEYAGSRNNELFPDYVHMLRQTIEQGDTAAGVTGLGGITVFANGALGGQVGPSGTRVVGPDGMPIANSGIPRAEALGRNVGVLALQALERTGEDITATPQVSYRTAPLFARVENTQLCYGLLAGAIERETFNFDRSRGCNRSNNAWVRSRVTYLQVGPVATITAPGELNGDLWVGYDERWAWGQPVLTETVNAPDLTMAPRAPYLRDEMLRNPGVRFAFVSGLTQDFLGYIIPRFNFVLPASAAYLAEAQGDHYEETFSISPDGEEHLHRPMMELARWRP